MLHSAIRFFIENKIISLLLLLILVVWGLITAPFNWQTGLPNSPVPVDAIPDIGENQQIVFTEWPGRSPQDIDDQITYPLTSALLGIPGVSTVRSTTMFGFSSIYIIFEDNIEFYWSRARILEKLSSLSPGTLPEGVQPSLGPDATALGQIFWYTLEGRDKDGNPAGGWDPHELRSIQDFFVKPSLTSASGVAEVASIGGFVKEYQIELDPIAMQQYGVSVRDVMRAVQESNMDTGARTLELNRVEYLIRGLGYIRDSRDLANAIVKVDSDARTGIRIEDVARVQLGPAQRRGVLDIAGAEAVGGVVVSRYGANPMAVIENVKRAIEEVSPGLPTRTLEDGRESQITIVPFYDRTELIQETLGTLQEALTLQILITIIVIIVMVLHLRASFLVSALLPAAVLITFILMRYTGVEANVVALAGIAIAIGTIVDMGIILTENMLRRLEEAEPGADKKEIIFKATTEVSSAVLTAVSTTIVSFLPVFTMIAAEGKLFRPLAYTKTYTLIAAILLTLVVLPPLAHWLFTRKISSRKSQLFWNIILVAGGVAAGFFVAPWTGVILCGLGLINLVAWADKQQKWSRNYYNYAAIALIILTIGWLFAGYWLPLGPANSLLLNMIFVLIIVGTVLALFRGFIIFYPSLLRIFLRSKAAFLAFPVLIVLLGLLSWQGFGKVFSPATNLLPSLEETRLWKAMSSSFPGMGREFMPALDEGSFLLMPTTMPHAGVEEIVDQMRKMDMRIASIPEVNIVAGKAGRAETALDPAPMSMFETVITYKSEYKTNEQGMRQRFRYEDGSFVRDDSGNLIPDSRGRYYRQWRDHITNPGDIWNEILAASRIPGTTSAPRLQPIETRLIMLQTGMRAPMGVKVSGPDLDTISSFALDIESVLQDVPGVNPASVFADRTSAKPYIELELDRLQIARYGLSVMDVQEVIETAIGGRALTTTVEGRERYPVRIRFARDFRSHPDDILRLPIAASDGAQIPLSDLVNLHYTTGPAEIRSENTFLINYVIFDRDRSVAEITAVDNARDALRDAVQSGRLIVPDGASYSFVGQFENQIRAEERLKVIIPLSLLIIFMILYLQFRSGVVAAIIFSGIAVAWAGGFILLWFYGQSWFMDFHLFGTSFRDLFNMGTINLSVAVWVGFLALFGIAVDDGVVMGTYLKQSFRENPPANIKEIREAVVAAGMRRIRPCLMTSATTILALIPILTSTGRGSDIMIPMAIPAVGGMSIQLLTLFVVPVLYALWQEQKFKNKAERTETNSNKEDVL
ncbi:MAG: efflux RND transporter permease subunit [Balneolales bacterium]|nr:efflux RND transporter permease subunit [Balneolales bacterium]